MVSDFMVNVPKQTNGIKTVVLDGSHQAEGDPLRDRVRSLRLPPDTVTGNPFIRLLKWLVALGLIGAVAAGVYIYYPLFF